MSSTPSEPGHSNASSPADDASEGADTPAHAQTAPYDAHHIDNIVRRRGMIAGWLVAWPFFVLTLTACAIAAYFQWLQRPQLVPFTVGLYLCMAFFAHAYSVAWEAENHLRQMFSMVIVVCILIALVALHLDDGAARWVYHNGHRILRPVQPLLRLAVALDIIAIAVILSHGLGLGFGHRFFHKESGVRVSRSIVKTLLRDARDRFGPER